jgi:hypothetical protein
MQQLPAMEVIFNLGFGHLDIQNDPEGSGSSLEIIVTSQCRS